MAKSKGTSKKKTPSKSKHAKLLKHDSLLKSLLPKGIQYDDVKKIYVEVKDLNIDINVTVGPKDDDYGVEGKLAVKDLFELIENIAKQEGLKFEFIEEESIVLIEKK